jgi:hypothetical protein
MPNIYNGINIYIEELVGVLCQLFTTQPRTQPPTQGQPRTQGARV